MRTDFKFWYIRRSDDGFIEEAAIRFYEGEYQTTVIDDKGNTGIAYVRTKRLTKNDLPHLDAKFKKEGSGADAKVYTTEDFGMIKTDEELMSFLNNEIKKDKNREVINEQK